MEKRIRLRHDAQSRAFGICEEHRGFFEARPSGVNHLAALGAAVSEVERQIAEHQRRVNEARAAAEICRWKRRGLRDRLRTIVKVSALLPLDEASAGAMDIPEVASDDRLVGDSKAILGAASAHVAAFVAEGMPPDFLTLLAAQIQEFKMASAAASDVQREVGVVIAAIAKAIRSGGREIDALVGLLASASDAPAGVLETLRQAKRVGRRTKDDTPPTPGTSSHQVA